MVCTLSALRTLPPPPPPQSIWKSYTYRVIFYRAKSKRYYYTIKHVYYIKMYILIITTLGHLVCT